MVARRSDADHPVRGGSEMKVLVESYGEQRRGIRSAQTGENLWALSLARALAKAGHQVHTIGYSEGRPWRKDPDGNFVDVRFLDDGTYKLLGTRKGEPLTNVDSGVVFWDRKELPACMDSGPFDVLFHQTVERDRWDASRFGKVLIGSFSWRTGHYDRPGWSAKPNDVFVLPHSWTDVPGISEGKDFRWLPLPAGDFSSRPCFESGAVAWTAKAAWRQREGEVGRAFEQWAAAFIELEACHSGTVFAFENEATRWFGGVPHHGMLEPDDYRRELSRHSIALPMHFAGSVLDCLDIGVLPLLYTGGGVGFFHPEVLEDISDGKTVLTATTKDIVENVEALLSSKDAFCTELSLLRRDAWDYTDAETVKRFVRIVEGD